MLFWRLFNCVDGGLLRCQHYVTYLRRVKYPYFIKINEKINADPPVILDNNHAH